MILKNLLTKQLHFLLIVSTHYNRKQEQASNLISYQRRQNLLPNLIKDSSRKVKAALLQKHHQNLFGKKFTARIIESEKLKKKKTMEILKSTSIFSSYKKPFPQRPSTVFIPKNMMWGVPVFIEIG